MAEPQVRTPERPLDGLAVLVTRPADQAESLCALLEGAGARAVRLPLLEIEPAGEDAPALELLRRPDHWDWLVFVSANAVRCALDIGGGALPASARARVAAVGAATARALAAAGIQVDLIPKAQFNSESLLAAPEMAEMAGRRVLIVRGEGGRELLAETLRARGAELAYAEVYRRRRAQVDAGALTGLWRSGGIDLAVATSGEVLDHLADILGEAGAAFAMGTPLAVIGARVGQLARQRGWSRVIVAEQASDAELAEAIVRFFRDGNGPR